MLRIVLTLGVCLPMLCACNRTPRASATLGRTAAPASAQQAQSTLRFRQLPASDALRGIGTTALGDCDGDGVLDLIAVAYTPEPAAGTPVPETTPLHFARGDGRGGFTRYHTDRIRLPNISCLTAADVNGDGKAEAACAWHDNYEYIVTLKPGADGHTRTLQGLLALGSHPHTHSLEAADLNADGHVDLLATCADDNAVAVQLGQGGFNFSAAPGSPYAAGVHPYDHINCIDVNGDTHRDVVVANLHGNTVSVLLGDGTGALELHETLAAGERPGFATVGDLDGDGALDILASHDDDPLLAVYYGDGKGGFTPAPGSPLRLPARIWDMELVDLDGDGANELVGAETLADDGAVLVFPGGRYAEMVPQPQRIAVEGGELHRAATADFNKDGKLDLLITLWDAHEAVVLLQD